MKNLENDDFVFAGKNKNRGTIRLVSAIFQRISDESNIHLHPHKIRHTYATYSLISGMDIHVLQRQLGHEDIKMTLKYVHIAESVRFEKVQKFVHYRFREPNFLAKSVKISEIISAFSAMNIKVVPEIEN